MFDFIILSLSIFNVYSNLEFFKWMNFDSNEILDTEMEDEQRDELENLELGRISSVSEGKTCEIDAYSGS